MIDGLTGDKLLDCDELAAVAASWTGLADFGDEDDYRDSLQRLLDAFNGNRKITGPARANLNLFLVMQMIGRLYSRKGWNSRPECLDQPIAAPLIITGIVRSGSTALHRLLALDPQFQTLEHWLSRIPMPRPPRANWNSIREYQICAGILDGQVREQPILQLAHLMGDPGDAEESQSLMSQSFVSVTYGNLAEIPEYDEWFWQADQRPAYRSFADNLRLIGANDQDKTWLLKNPGDALALDAVLSEFPDARIIQTHRSPLEAMPSLCSMLTGFRALFEGPEFDRAALGRRTCHEWRLAVDRMAAVRAEYDRPDRFVDIDFHRFRRDPMWAVRRIYDHFRLELAPEVEREMTSWVQATRSAPFSQHEYALGEYGLCEEGIRGEFNEYMNAMGYHRI